MALTAYTTIKKTRRAAGVNIKKERKEPIGAGDGDTVTFQVRYPMICSKDYAGSPDSTDIYVYLDNSDTPEDSGNYSIDAEAGEITFNSAPAAADVVETTYWHSTVSDDDIDEAISLADKDINDTTYRSFYDISDTKLQWTQKWNGTGKRRTFFFEYLPLTSVQSLTVDGNAGYVEDTDYYLYPRSAEAHWIEFESAPTNDKKNISITYDYGEAITDVVTRLSTILAAEKIVLDEMARRGTSGSQADITSSGKIRGSTNRFVNTLKFLERQEKRYWGIIGNNYRIKDIR